MDTDLEARGNQLPANVQSQRCSNSEARAFASLLISGYPNSIISDPEYYIAQVVTVLVEFTREQVKEACAPQGIPADYPTFVPTIGQIMNWLKESSSKVEEDDRATQSILDTRRYLRQMEKLEAQPRPKAKRTGPPLHLSSPIRNLFVAVDRPGYDRVVQFTKEAPNKYWAACEEGVWVPNDWYRSNKAYQQWESGLLKNQGFGKWQHAEERKKQKPLTDKEREALLADARATGEKISGIKLSDEAKKILHHDDADG